MSMHGRSGRQRSSDSAGLLRQELKQLVAAIRQHRDLAERLDLIFSIDGIGLPTAVAILVRLPELGRVSRQQIAALSGLAPYDDDSGQRSGKRHIAGGRKRVRGSLYAAALAASFRWNAELIALYRRLSAAGKEHKVCLVACARKLLIFANTVVARGTPWQPSPPERSKPVGVGLGLQPHATPRFLVRPESRFFVPTWLVLDAARRRRQGWPSRCPAPHSAVARPRLDGVEHGVSLHRR